MSVKHFVIRGVYAKTFPIEIKLSKCPAKQENNDTQSGINEEEGK